MSGQGSPTFVLVHGTWHGGWCWKKVVPLLRHAGSEVFAPTLSGLGERVHLLSPHIDLDTHIADVVGLLTYEDLYNVILVGHSYGGMVISGVANQLSSRVTRLVYLDAFLPEGGKAIQHYASDVDLQEIADTRGDGWRLPPYYAAHDFGITNDADAAWVNERLGDQPYKTFTQPLSLSDNVYSRTGHAYILTSQGFAAHAERAREMGFLCYSLATETHDSMVTHAAELTTLLLTIARS